MTKEELAKELDGCQYRKEVSPQLEKQAEENGLIVIFGASDDLVEFRGLIGDEFGAYNGTKIWLYRNKKGVKALDESAYQDIKDEIEENELDLDLPTEFIKAVWSPKELINFNGIDYDASWMIESKIPHAKFHVMEEMDLYCQGIVIDSKDIK